MHSDALVFPHGSWTPEHDSFQWHPLCKPHVDWPEIRLQGVAEPLHELDEELQLQPSIDEHVYDVDWE